MSDTPETDLIEDQLGSYAKSSHPAIWKHSRKLERERDEAMYKLEDWEDSAKHVRSEWPDEQHCSCVPILRKLLKDAERERDEARELAHRFRSLYYTQLGIESSASWFPWEGRNE